QNVTSEIPIFAEGGTGGTSGGLLARLTSTGGSGTSGTASRATLAPAISGQAGTGGCNFAGSGFVESDQIEIPIAQNGQKGKRYGQGGNGALVFNLDTPIESPGRVADGGNGNAAFLMIDAFQLR